MTKYRIDENKIVKVQYKLTEEKITFFKSEETFTGTPMYLVKVESPKAEDDLYAMFFKNDDDMFIIEYVLWDGKKSSEFKETKVRDPKYKQKEKTQLSVLINIFNKDWNMNLKVSELDKI